MNTTKKPVVSPKNTLVAADKKKLLKNFVKFVAPTLAIFFGQLAIGVKLEAAILVAVLALYQALSDLFSKWSSETEY